MASTRRRRSESSHSRRMCSGRRFGAGHAVVLVLPDHPALGEDERAVRHALERPRHHLLGVAQAVDGGGVDPGHPGVERRVDGRDRLLVVLRTPAERPVTAPDRPRAEADRGDLGSPCSPTCVPPTPCDPPSESGGDRRYSAEIRGRPPAGWVAPDDGAVHTVLHLVRERDRDVREPGLGEETLVLAAGQRTRRCNPTSFPRSARSAGLSASSATTSLIPTRPPGRSTRNISRDHGGLVGRQVDHAVRDHDVDGRRRAAGCPRCSP